jgi:hypothetical protein
MTLVWSGSFSQPDVHCSRTHCSLLSRVQGKQSVTKVHRYMQRCTAALQLARCDQSPIPPTCTSMHKCTLLIIRHNCLVKGQSTASTGTLACAQPLFLACEQPRAHSLAATVIAAATRNAFFSSWQDTQRQPTREPPRAPRPECGPRAMLTRHTVPCLTRWIRESMVVDQSPRSTLVLLQQPVTAKAFVADLKHPKQNTQYTKRGQHPLSNTPQHNPWDAGMHSTAQHTTSLH